MSRFENPILDGFIGEQLIKVLFFLQIYLNQIFFCQSYELHVGSVQHPCEVRELT